MKLLGLSGNSAQSIDGFGKTWDTKYQIPKLSARTNVSNSKESTTVSTATVTTSPLSIPNQDTNSTKSMAGFISKIHGGRASSVSPKYNSNIDSNVSGFNKDIHSYKSNSSDTLHHQSQLSGQHMSSSRYGNV